MADINTAEIEARLADDYEHHGDRATYCADIATLLTALKAETARADKAEQLVICGNEFASEIGLELHAANEKLKAAISWIEDLPRKNASHQMADSLLEKLRATTGDSHGR